MDWLLLGIRPDLNSTKMGVIGYIIETRLLKLFATCRQNVNILETYQTDNRSQTVFIHLMEDLKGGKRAYVTMIL